MSSENQDLEKDQVAVANMKENKNEGQSSDEAPRKTSLKKGLKSLDAGNARIIYLKSSPPNQKTLLSAQIIFIFIAACLNVACIVIGCYKVGMCPIAPEIPFYLVIKGAVGLADIPSFAFQQLLLKKENPSTPRLCCVYMVRTFLFTSNFAILIYGSIKVYSVYEPKYDGDSYCDELCYKLSFTVLTFMWCSLGLAICCCCCAIPLYCIFLQATYGHSRNASIDEGTPKLISKTPKKQPIP